MRKIRNLTCFTLGGLLLTLTGCSSSSSGDGSGGNQTGQTEDAVQLYTWWSAPGEAQALQGLVDQYKVAYPNGSVDDSGAMSGADSRAQLDTAFSSGTFPDVFQLNTQDLGPFSTTHAGQVASAFNQGAAALASATSSANQQVTATVAQINQLAGQIAAINGQLASTTASGQDGGDLEDQRDALVTQLAGLASHMCRWPSTM